MDPPLTGLKWVTVVGSLRTAEIILLASWGLRVKNFSGFGYDASEL